MASSPGGNRAPKTTAISRADRIKRFNRTVSGKRSLTDLANFKTRFSAAKANANGGTVTRFGRYGLRVV